MMAQSSNEIKGIFREMMADNARNIHTAIPATVMMYDVGSNRADVQPFGNVKAPDGQTFPYPIIYNVPVVFPTGVGGSAGVTFPVVSGDGCLLVFSEDNLDDYLSGGDSDDLRKHSLNDAICIPGLYSGARTAGVAHAGDTCLFNGGSMLRINSGGIIISAGGTSVTIGGGTVNVGGDVVASGISLTGHTHPGCQGGSTGAPN